MQPTQQISHMIWAVDNDVGALSSITDSFAHHAWHKQELFKGRGLGVGLGATDWSGWNIEENWFGVNKISVEQAFSMSDIINCYSPTEDILANATVNGWGGVWGAQELFKGTASLHFVPGNCEGGWGYNDEYTNIAGILTDFAKTNEFTNLELIVNPLFRKLDNGIFHQTNSIAIAQTELNKVMSDAIPATSFAAGANDMGRGLKSYNMHDYMVTSWPRKDSDGKSVWYHSDIKDVAYYFTHGLFEKVMNGE